MPTDQNPTLEDGITTLFSRRCVACKARRIGLCQPLADSEIGIVANFKIGDRHLASGDHLYHEGDLINEVYNLLDGWVLLYQLLPDGRRQIVEILLRGAFFGFQPDLRDRMSHSAVCATPVAVCVFPKARLIDLFRDHTELALRALTMCARDRLEIHDHLTSVGRRTARERVAHLLCELDHRLRVSTPGAETAIPLTQAQIGDALGLTEIHVNRTLQTFREDGLVRTGRGVIHVLRSDRLADIAGIDAGQSEWPQAPMRERGNLGP
jgi:CRP/FNR family transcriptional regulator